MMIQVCKSSVRDLRKILSFLVGLGMKTDRLADRLKFCCAQSIESLREL